MATAQQDDKGLGELVARLSEHAKAYAKAEADYWKTAAAVRARSVKSAAILVLFALLLASGAFVALIVGLLLSLATVTGPLIATGIVVAATMLVAGLLGYLAYRGLQRAFGSPR